MSQYSSFRDFYPFYLGEHANPTCRRLHFIGSSGILIVIALVLAQVLPLVWLWAIPILGYGFAWVGHFFFEKNRPATFKYPFYSLLGDWVMYKDMLTGKIRI
ncbi:MAG: Mpo1-like protein [Arenimonas sp.]